MTGTLSPNQRRKPNRLLLGFRALSALPLAFLIPPTSVNALDPFLFSLIYRLRYLMHNFRKMGRRKNFLGCARSWETPRSLKADPVPVGEQDDTGTLSMQIPVNSRVFTLCSVLPSFLCLELQVLILPICN